MSPVVTCWMRLSAVAWAPSLCPMSSPYSACLGSPTAATSPPDCRSTLWDLKGTLQGAPDWDALRSPSCTAYLELGSLTLHQVDVLLQALLGMERGGLEAQTPQLN